MANNHRNHRTSKPSAVKSLREVEFHFESTTAKSVHLAGDFNEWATDRLPLRKESSGHWRVRVPLAPGPHQYRFVVDGLWVDDPSACRRPANPFGSCNCEVLVGWTRRPGLRTAEVPKFAQSATWNCFPP